jgi:hypothetical protein
VGQTAKKPRITGSARKDLESSLITKYEAGKSIRTLAAEIDKSYGFVHGILASSGTRLRGRGGATRKRGTVEG